MHGVMMTTGILIGGAETFAGDLLAQFGEVFHLLWDKLWPVLAIFIGFSLIIFVHELGHFLVAKWCDVRVEKFAIGFGKELFGFTRGETRYSFNVLPLGGYVKMLGQEDFDDKTLELKNRDDARSFGNKSVERRMAIVSAGVLMNLVFALLLFVIVFLVGIEARTPRIGLVIPDSPADRAGLRAGDLVRKINGSSVHDWGQLGMEVALTPPFEVIEFVVERDGQLQPPISVMPEANTTLGQPTIGIHPSATRKLVQVGPSDDFLSADGPRAGDLLAEVAGQPVTERNVNEMFVLAAFESSFVVERPIGGPSSQKWERRTVRITPRIQLYPGDPGDRFSGNILGMQPLVRWDNVAPGQRADLGGLRDGDTVLMWDDIPHPSAGQVVRSIQNQPERDIPYIVRGIDGRTRCGFVRPGRTSKRRGTIGAYATSAPGDPLDAAHPRAVLAGIVPGGPADRAGLREGDVVVRWGDVVNPAPCVIDSEVDSRARRDVTVVVRRGQEQMTVRLPIEVGGMIQAVPAFIASNDLTVARVLPDVMGRPTPAALAGIPDGAVIKSIDETTPRNWDDVIRTLRLAAGRKASVTYGLDGREFTTQLEVPPTLRTALELGLASNIVSIDGKQRFLTRTVRGNQELSIDHPEGLRACLEECVGRTVEVKFRRHPASAVETQSVIITADMVEPWDRRIVYQSDLYGDNETFLLREKNPIAAIRLGVRKTYDMVIQVYQTIDRMAFSRSLSADSISGPVGIVSIGGTIARQGPMQLLFFLAMLSANLAVLNFLPLPIVDGGLMVFLLIEKIKGSPVSMKIQVMTQMVGIVLIVTAFLYVTFNDVVKLFN